ncbi:MAG: hypothetical protein IKN04_09050 [Clostridia bacterium]|nr:hypothetical protein [Clostridia bacterium]
MKKDASEQYINTIHDLEACSFLKNPDCARCTKDGPGFGFACRDQLRMQALSALKEQQKRIQELEAGFHAKVMSAEEAAKNAYSFYHTPDSVKPVFVQFRDEIYADEGLAPPWRGGVNQRALLKRAGKYGIKFVFWTDRPSKEQMEGVEWDG